MCHERGERNRFAILDLRFTIAASVIQGYRAGSTALNEQQFKNRTKQLGVRIIRMVDALPQSRSADVIGRQILRSATSVGANYRAACRAKSTVDIINKLKIVEEEADETLF